MTSNGETWRKGNLLLIKANTGPRSMYDGPLELASAYAYEVTDGGKLVGYLFEDVVNEVLADHAAALRVKEIEDRIQGQDERNAIYQQGWADSASRVKEIEAALKELWDADQAEAYFELPEDDYGGSLLRIRHAWQRLLELVPGAVRQEDGS